VDALAQNLETIFQIRLNNRFGMMSAHLVELQSDIEQNLQDQFFNFRADILGICHTLRQELNSFRFRSPLASGNIPSANVPLYRSTSNRMDMGDFRDSHPPFSDNFSSRHFSPMSARSNDSRTDSSSSVATILLGSSPRMDSSRVVIDFSHTNMKTTGRIVDYDTSRKFLLDFHHYRQSGGSKKLSTLLQEPLDPKKPLISNFSSLFFKFDETYLFGDEYIENK